MPRFVRGHAGSGDGIQRIDRLGERQLLRHRVVVVGQHAVGADNLHVGDYLPRAPGPPAAWAPVNPRRLRTFEYLLKAGFTRALAQSENPNPGRDEEEIHRVEKHSRYLCIGDDVGRGEGGPQHSSAPMSGPHRVARSEEPAAAPCPSTAAVSSEASSTTVTTSMNPPALAAGWSPR